MLIPAVSGHHGRCSRAGVVICHIDYLSGDLGPPVDTKAGAYVRWRRLRLQLVHDPIVNGRLAHVLNETPGNI
jgi:hypothetical protein